MAVLVLAAARLAAWQDPFNDWSAQGYLQILQVDRPASGRPPVGPLNDVGQGAGAGGYTWDGPYARMLDLSISGPLGWKGFSAVLETQDYLGNPTLADMYVRWDVLGGSLRVGQTYLAFGVEDQTDYNALVGIQRGLMYGFDNYGSTQPWGLQLMDLRGMGARWDQRRTLWGPLEAIGEAGVSDFGGGEVYRAAAGVMGRAALRVHQAWFSLEAAYSGLEASARLIGPAPAFAPLGAASGAAFVPSADLAGRQILKTWGPDARLDLGPLHALGEWAQQSLGPGWTRGGSQVSLWLDLDTWLRGLGVPKGFQRAYLYAQWEQAGSSFSDGIHLGNALYESSTYGVRLPLGWRPASLKVEYLQVSSAAFGGTLPDGRIVQTQFQLEL